MPAHIRLKRELDIEPAMTEMESLAWMKEVSAKNKVYRSYIGSSVFFFFFFFFFLVGLRLGGLWGSIAIIACWLDFCC